VTSTFNVHLKLKGAIGMIFLFRFSPDTTCPDLPAGFPASASTEHANLPLP